MKSVRTALLGFALAVALDALTSGPALSAENAVAYQENVAHTGNITFAAGFSAPLRRKWVRDLGGSVSYPLIVGDIVFVTVANGLDYGSRLVALNLNTGKTIWDKPISGTYFSSHIAYDRGRIFNVNEDGLLRAFAADKTGASLWTTQIPFQYVFNTPPIATGGQVFVGGSGVGGNIYALKGKSGQFIWSAFLDQSADGMPAYGDKGIYITVICNYYRLSSRTGQILWHTDRNGCGGGGGYTPVFYNNLIFAREDPFLRKPVLLNAQSGKILRSLQISQPPAIWTPPEADPLQIAPLAGSTLRAYDVVSGKLVWVFTSHTSYFSTPALVINNIVVAGAVDGTLYVLDAASGKKLWSTNVGDSIGPAISSHPGPIWGLNAGSGALLVPAQYTLSSYVPQ